MQFAVHVPASRATRRPDPRDLGKLGLGEPQEAARTVVDDGDEDRSPPRLEARVRRRFPCGRGSRRGGGDERRQEALHEGDGGEEGLQACRRWWRRSGGRSGTTSLVVPRRPRRAASGRRRRRGHGRRIEHGGELEQVGNRGRDGAGRIGKKCQKWKKCAERRERTDLITTSRKSGSGGSLFLYFVTGL